MSNEKPWDVMRRTAWASLCAAVALPDTADEATRKTISDAALTYARASGMKWADAKSDGTAPRRQATGERSAVAGDGPLVRFGRDKGKPIADVDDLSWYRAALQTSVEDPSKARFLEQNRAHLEEVDTELRARGGR